MTGKPGAGKRPGQKQTFHCPGEENSGLRDREGHPNGHALDGKRKKVFRVEEEERQRRMHFPGRKGRRYPLLLPWVCCVCPAGVGGGAEGVQVSTSFGH